MRLLHRKHVIDHLFAPFSDANNEDAIRASSNSTALGPDGLCSLHLKHLSPKGIKNLTSLFNLSLSDADLPSIWKEANIIPVLKLLLPAVKILERLLLPLITEFLPHSSSRHGFIPGRYTTTAVLPLVLVVAIGFNEAKPTAAVAIDVSKAFDGVSHTLLLQKIMNSDLHSNIVRWLACYLRGRQSTCLLRSASNSKGIVHVGVPQGSVTSPALFNFFLLEFPGRPGISELFANDITIGKTSPVIQVLKNSLTAALTSVSTCASEK
jgi:hypothetical protein